MAEDPPHQNDTTLNRLYDRKYINKVELTSSLNLDVAANFQRKEEDETVLPVGK